jgi:hypothetical protein
MTKSELDTQKKALYKQLDTYWSKIEAILISKNMRGDDLRKMSDTLRATVSSDREEVILNNFGSLYLDRISPLLYQVNTIENELTALGNIAAK